MPPTTRRAKKPAKVAEDKNCVETVVVKQRRKVRGKHPHVKQAAKVVTVNDDDTAYQADLEEDSTSTSDENPPKIDKENYDIDFAISRIQKPKKYNKTISPGIQTDKVNLTPPEIHSTPATSKAVRKLDDSLFGFNDLSSPLPFSPVPAVNSHRNNISVISNASSTTLAIDKSKKHHLNPIAQDDPFQMPNKRKKPKKKQTGNYNENTDNLIAALHDEFKQIEMHELEIE